jgi:hypothetical protein
MIPANERHYTVAEIAARWGVAADLTEHDHKAVTEEKRQKSQVEQKERKARVLDNLVLF